MSIALIVFGLVVVGLVLSAMLVVWFVLNRDKR